MNCNNCNQPLQSKYAKKFCNRSCAISFNNRNKPKRKLTKVCKHCDTLVRSDRARCDPCVEKRRRVIVTLADAIYTKGDGSNAYSYVRYRARLVCKDRDQACVECGYSVHVEACHIKAINSFTKETLLTTINDPDNLVLMCRNCHWEFDHGLLELS